MTLETITNKILEAIIYILPAYVANATPTIFGGGKPIDLGKKFIDGKRIFGDHKTIRGLISGIICGILTGPLLYLLQLEPNLYHSTIKALLLSIGTHIGDLLGSFIKRRLNLKPGASAPILDQLGFLVCALLITYPLYPTDTTTIIILITLTLILHPLTNLIAYLAKIKETPY